MHKIKEVHECKMEFNSTYVSLAGCTQMADAAAGFHGGTRLKTMALKEAPAK